MTEMTMPVAPMGVHTVHEKRHDSGAMIGLIVLIILVALLFLFIFMHSHQSANINNFTCVKGDIARISDIINHNQEMDMLRRIYNRQPDSFRVGLSAGMASPAPASSGFNPFGSFNGQGNGSGNGIGNTNTNTSDLNIVSGTGNAVL